MNETKLSANGWTVDTLHEHIVKLLEAKEQRDEERFRAQEKTTVLALTAADKAVSKAEASAEKRFESVNEFRSTLADQQRTLMPRNESELITDGINDRVRTLENRMINQHGRGEGFYLGWMIVLGIISLIGAAGTVISILRAFK